MHAANRAAWDEAAERYEGWFDEAVALIRSGGTNLFGVETELIGDLHGRCRRAIHLQCAGRPRHAVALEPGRRRGRRRRLQPADARPRRAPRRGDRCTGPLDPGRRARHAARARRQRRPRLHGSRLAHLARRPRRLGGRDRAAAVARRPVRPVRGAPRGVAVRRRRRRPLDRHRLRLLRRDRGVEGLGARVHRPAVARRSRDQSWKFARAWTLGEVITALLGADLRLEQVAEHPIDWWGGHADVRAEERGRIPLSFSVVGRRGA